ncbi:hypothetical protein GCM10027346_28970 [Hymenobacter seoulensis]
MVLPKEALAGAVVLAAVWVVSVMVGEEPAVCSELDDWLQLARASKPANPATLLVSNPAREECVMVKRIELGILSGKEQNTLA